MHGPDDEVIPLHPPFETVLRGFHRHQVVEHIEALEARLAMVEADREAALGQVGELTRVLEHLRREAEDATTRLELLQRSSLAGAGVHIQRMMQRTEHELAELQASAQQETSALRERTRADTDEMVRRTSERCERMEAEARGRVAEYQTRALTALHLLLTVAGQELTQRTVEMRREVGELTSVHVELSSRLAAMHRTLAAALADLPLDDLVDGAGADQEPAHQTGRHTAPEQQPG